MKWSNPSTTASGTDHRNSHNPTNNSANWQEIAATELCYVSALSPCLKASRELTIVRLYAQQLTATCFRWLHDRLRR